MFGSLAVTMLEPAKEKNSSKVTTIAWDFVSGLFSAAGANDQTPSFAIRNTVQNCSLMKTLNPTIFL
jgi:hypothetical protein